MRSLSRRCVNRVIAPEGEILSFAQPLESIQRKGGSIAAQSALLGFASGRQRGLPALLPTRGIHAEPLRANPNKTCGARRSNESKASLLRNISY